eukprot:TRINITY_DN64854_c0_g1_i1.p1 TRINITY_DN64854_c0_g1~~TRINITY_DN64854_c0_g1_i1.p1  ORF type:complete len:510 (-),score=66.08 TRINITY_DN64854_c0_g1_i1:84-1586(-)
MTGLWQVADQERLLGNELDLEKAAANMLEYYDNGFRTFDMADHYGSAELIAARCRQLLGARSSTASGSDPPLVVATKWCPEPGEMNTERVRAGVQERLDRLGVEKVDLLQLHWWQWEHLAYVDAARELAAQQAEGRIAHLGLTNTDTDHLRVIRAVGANVATNQVSFSLLDRRASGRMSEYCLESGVRLVCYGSLCGGFLSSRWLGAEEPTFVSKPETSSEHDPVTWSQMKYKRFIDAAGGWNVLQALLRAANVVAQKHGVSIANVATRWVLEQPAVAAVIVGARLGERHHREDNARIFTFALDAEDHATLDAALQGATPLPGDCGDEYRRPPFLTASGDLSHHLSRQTRYFQSERIPGCVGDGVALRVRSGSEWEPLAGYCRAVRRGSWIQVSGTTATHGVSDVICRDDPLGQAVYTLDKILASIVALGGRREDVARTRVYLTDVKQWEPVARAHGRYFGDVLPANTLLAVAALVGDYIVEIEAEAFVPEDRQDNVLAS